MLKDEPQAVAWYRKAAKQGHPSAQYNLGVCCQKERGMRQDDVQAVRWYRKAADQGVADAQYNLGIMYASGQGVQRDNDQAVAWWHKAAEQNHELAIKTLRANNLGHEPEA